MLSFEDNVRAILECNFAETKEEIVEMAVRQIMRLSIPTAQQWIPISERRPAPHEPVIICSDKGVCHIGMDIDIERWMIDGKILCVDELGEFAWMPFPEPWKGGEE